MRQDTCSILSRSPDRSGAAPAEAGADGDIPRATACTDDVMPIVRPRCQPSQAGSFFFTATFFSATYLGRPSVP